MDDALGTVFKETFGWPLPGAGTTLLRWQNLSRLAEDDLVVARLAEAHADALAILAELGAPEPSPESRWGVWAAESPRHRLTAAQSADGWLVSGPKAWCSGATLLTHALVTAWDGDTGRLFAVDLGHGGVTAGPDEWASAGMKAADTRTVVFSDVPAVEVGPDGRYLSRPGFWIGGIGVASCWYGGAVAVARPLRQALARKDEPHAAAHLGAVDVSLAASRNALTAAAAEIDASPLADHERLARQVRSTVAQTAVDVIDRVGRALGPGPLAADAEHAQRVADLLVYVRQDHAEKDLAGLGARVVADPDGWSL